MRLLSLILGLLLLAGCAGSEVPYEGRTLFPLNDSTQLLRTRAE